MILLLQQESYLPMEENLAFPREWEAEEGTHLQGFQREPT